MKNILTKNSLTDSKFLKYLGMVLTSISLWLVIKLLIENISIFADFYTSKSMITAILIGLFFYGISQLNAALSWYILLHERYPNVTFKTQYLIISVSQIAKYLPGNFAHIIGRAYLSKLYGLNLTDVSKYIFIETLLLIYASVMIGLAYFLLFDHSLLFIDTMNHGLLLVILTLLIGTPLLFYKKIIQSQLIKKSIFYVLTLNLISFCALGMVLFVFQQLVTVADVSLLKYTIAISIAFIVGFVVPGAPAGIGVREYVFIVVMSNELSSADALNLIMGLRVVNVLGDLIMYISSYWFKKGSQ